MLAQGMTTKNKGKTETNLVSIGPVQPSLMMTHYGDRKAYLC